MTNFLAQILALLFSLASCSFDSCDKPVGSEGEANQALQKFFTSRSTTARELIETLRKDGITDGERGRGYDKRYWYVAVSIAPVEAKKDVVLEIQCPSVVRLDHTLYGG